MTQMKMIFSLGFLALSISVFLSIFPSGCCRSDGVRYFFLNNTVSRVKRSFKERHREITAPDMIVSRGYPAEVHEVLTKDGYILRMHRIPGPHISSRQGAYSLPGRGRPVYIQHCVLCSSNNFVLSNPHQALSYVLADAGFDVWLGNYRGNVYSKSHLRLTPDDKAFWKFSFMEMAHYDIPAMVYYILEKTGRQNISYVGHSMGTTGLFAANSLMPELNKKIRVMAAMAPVAYLDHIIGPMKYLLQYFKYTYKVYEKRNNAYVIPRSRLRSKMAKKFCKKDSIFLPICKSFFPAFVGLNRGYIDDDYLRLVLSQMPAGTSARTLAHLGQLVEAGKFQMFDMGAMENLRHYGTTFPPNFDIRKTTTPVGLFWSSNDWVSQPRDVARIARELPNLTLNFRVPQDDFNHLDFLFSKTAKEVLYLPLTGFLLAH